LHLVSSLPPVISPHIYCIKPLGKPASPQGSEHMFVPPSVTPKAFEQLAVIGASKEGKALRVAVEGGGCSGFQYEIKLDDPAADDLVLEGAGEKVVIDEVSQPFLTGAKIDYVEELIGARFVIENPNASSSCGCGVSFSM
jgi:iron-sulfur cluster insertion protein